MAMIGKPDRGTVEMNSEECKGCGLCVEACPPKVLHLAEGLNRYGYRPGGLRAAGAAPAAASVSSFVPNRAAYGCSAWRPPRRMRMQKQLTKGNEAIVKAAVLAGCRAFYGYPITPASEIAEAAALYLPRAGGVFVQAESEVAAINMLYGGAAAGVRCMTASSGPGISLMQEGFSYLAGAELPCVIADIMRGGPGLGNIAPEQGDYNQIVKGGGHGNYRTLVVAPDSVQEMADLTTLAFDLADRYRNPVVVLADGFIGQMMEPVEFASRATLPAPPEWAVRGNAETRKNLVSSIYLEPDNLERHIRKLEEKYQQAARAGSALRKLAHGRRGDRPGGLRDCGTHPEGRGGAGAGARHRGGSAAADHAVPVPLATDSRTGANTPRPSPWWNSAPARWWTTCAWRWPAAPRWNSSAAWAATRHPPRTCWRFWNVPFRTACRMPAHCGRGGADPWLATP